MPALLQTLLRFYFSPNGRISRGAFCSWFWLGSVFYLVLLAPILLALGFLLIPDLIYVFFCTLFTLQPGCVHFEAFTKLYETMAAYLWVSAAFTLLLLPSLVFVPLKRLRDAGLSPLLLMIWFLPPANLLLALALSFYPTSTEPPCAPIGD
jgi:uncharacterized membrane protein YhaH (DUF805 family)